MTVSPPLPPDLEVSTTLEDMRRWAELSGDYNRLHVDPDFAASMGYGRPIVHGHLTVAWITRWATSWAGPSWLRGGRIDGLRYRQPLYADTVYRVRGIPSAVDPAVVALEIVQPDGTRAVEAIVTRPPDRR